MLGLFAAVLFVAVTTVPAQAQPQFAGTWTLDHAQSQFPARKGGHHGHRGPEATPGEAKQPPVVKLIVEQDGVAMKVTRAIARDDREHSMSQSFVADGSERARQGRHGSTTVSKATLGGDRLVTTSTTTRPAKDGGEARTYSRESTWTLSPDGRTLTIDTVMRTPRGDKTMKTVYVKS
jgi:hypothetical protein